MSAVTGILIYLGIGVFAGTVALVILRRHQSDHLAGDDAENLVAAVGVGLLWPFSIVFGLVAVAVLMASRVLSHWVEDRWPSKTPR